MVVGGRYKATLKGWALMHFKGAILGSHLKVAH